MGVVAAALNREGSLGPAPGRRSRGELALEALDHAAAAAAAEAVAQLDPAAYRTFNLIVADAGDGFWLRHAGGARVELRRLKEGLSMIAAGDVDDLGTRRLALALPAFRAWPAPEPDRGDWAGWEALLGSTRAPSGEPATAAMGFRVGGCGTVSSALIALPACDGAAAGHDFGLPNGSPSRHRGGRSASADPALFAGIGPAISKA